MFSRPQSDRPSDRRMLMLTPQLETVAFFHVTQNSKIYKLCWGVEHVLPLDPSEDGSSNRTPRYTLWYHPRMEYIPSSRRGLGVLLCPRPGSE